MASYTAVSAKTQTLTAATVDDVTLSPGWIAKGRLLTVVNWHATEDLWFTISMGGTAATPTDGGDNCLPVMPASATSILLPPQVVAATGVDAAVQVKLIGNANKYTVCVLPTVGI